VATSALAAKSGEVDPPAGAVSLATGAEETSDEPVIHVPTIPSGQALVKDPKGTRELPPSALSDLDIPAAALLAYQRAEVVMEQVDESCGLSWTLLAAIGRIESDHGRYGGAVLGNDGVSNPPIRGVPLDGQGPVAEIRDTDAGELDGDPVWDRAVGPMQFLPTTWSVVGVDADGDGVRSPDDLDDAALAAAVFLCSAPGNLDSRSGREAAVFRYNPSQEYVTGVLELEQAYRNGDFHIPESATSPDSVEVVVDDPSGHGNGDGGGKGDAHGDGNGQGDGSQHGTGDGQADGDGGHDGNGHQPGSNNTPDPGGTPGPTDNAPDPSGTPDPTDNAPDPSGTPDPTDNAPDPSDTPNPSDTPDPTPDPPDPSDTPDPTPDPPELVTLTEVLAACGTDLTEWCLGDTTLDVGDADFLAATAVWDFDADGVVETNTGELTGLAGTEVTLLVMPDTTPAEVVAVNGQDWDPDR
jgi:hypothetical protein